MGVTFADYAVGSQISPTVGYVATYAKILRSSNWSVFLFV